MPPPVLIIAGPTSAGKSALAAHLAPHIHGHILCADPFQLYQGLPTLTAQPTPDLLSLAPHHLYSSLPPTSPINAATYAQLALPLIHQLLAQNLTPILVGGSGLYLKALTHGLDPIPTPPPHLRQEINSLPIPQLLTRIHQLDPSALQSLDTHNPARLRRALEILLTTGKPLSALRKSWQQPPRLHYLAFTLLPDRPSLHARIHTNVAHLLQAGAISEVQNLRHLPLPHSLTSIIGFREISLYLDGNLPFHQLHPLISTRTRQYAKRQLTWFRAQPDYIPIPLPPNSNPLPHALQAILHHLHQFQPPNQPQSYSHPST